MAEWEALSTFALGIWLRARVFMMVWLLALFATAILYRMFKRRTDFDHLFWFMWPLLIASFVITPLIYVLARMW